MSIGFLEAIYVGAVTRGPMRGVDSVRAVGGLGLEGDRFWQGGTLPASKRGPDHEVTLIEAEAIEAVKRDCGVDLDQAETRRNLVTRGVALNLLVGRVFRVGGISLRGLRLCDPCRHLEAMTRPGVMKGLNQRGGLRAQILDEGVLKVGDPIEV